MLRKLSHRILGDRRRWIDEGLILSAKTLMASSGWRAPVQSSLSEKEFKVYSQFGDDGIIQYLIRAIPVAETSFIEFGVGDYFESNTHFLLVNDNWAGLVLDGSEEKVTVIRTSPIYWRHALTAETAFITRDNVMNCLTRAPFDRVGLLHIDLDGNDYWILERIDFERLPTDILVLEYNAVFGAEREITIPYDERFDRCAAHHSCLYWGASLPALASLAATRGFFFAGTNSAGNNAYFVSQRHRGRVPELTIREGFTDSRYRESRGPDFSMTYLSGESRISAIRELPVWNVHDKTIEPL